MSEKLSEVFAKFVEFKSYAKRHFNRMIKVLRSDNGGKYTSKIFNDYLRDKGIVHQTSVAYNSQQNGVSERANRTIMSRVRCMLADAGLAKKLWGEAVNTAVYLINRSPCSSIDFKVPEDVWVGHEVSIHHLRVFGSKCVTQVPTNKRQKLDNVGVERVLVGYSETQKGYRVLFNNNSVRVERNVKVFEGNHEKDSENIERNRERKNNLSRFIGGWQR